MDQTEPAVLESSLSREGFIILAHSHPGRQLGMFLDFRGQSRAKGGTSQGDRTHTSHLHSWPVAIRILKQPP